MTGVRKILENAWQDITTDPVDKQFLCYKPQRRKFLTASIAGKRKCSMIGALRLYGGTFPAIGKAKPARPLLFAFLSGNEDMHLNYRDILA